MDFSVGDIMRLNVKSVEPDMSLPDLERALVDEKVGGFPVVDSGELVGVISRSDIIRQLDVERNLAEITSDFYFDESGFHEIAAKTYTQIAAELGERIESLKVKDVMVTEVHTASRDWLLDKVAQIFVEHRIHRLPVVEGSRLVGIITTIDLTRLFADRRVEVRK